MLEDEYKNEENTLKLCCAAFLLTVFEYLSKRKQWSDTDQERSLLLAERLRRHDQAKEFSIQRNMADPEADHMLDWLNLETISLDPVILETSDKIRRLESEIKQNLQTLMSMGALYGEAKAYFDSHRSIDKMVHSDDYCYL